MLIFSLIAYFSVALVATLLLLVLVEPPLRYRICQTPPTPDTAEFLRLIESLSDATLRRGSSIDLLSDAKSFYPAELEAIRAAQRSVHIEAFIFHPGNIGQQFREALIERARAGVKVKIIIDAAGSFPTPRSFFQSLCQAGGEVHRYMPIGLPTLKHLNNRTHRELMIVDGETGFIGGAGIANHWDCGDKGKPPWRDMMFCVRGPLVVGLQTCFAENWLECSSDVLSEMSDFPPEPPACGASEGLVVISTPNAGRSTRNRLVFQLLLAAARKSVQIHSPYFLPDRSVTGELIRAVRERNVSVKIIVPGEANNHRMTRLASRRRYGPLLEAGVEIYEYQPGMIHTKSMTIDGLWSVVGSTNFDSRSFDLNDEVNLVARDSTLSQQIEGEFEADLKRCRAITYDAWRRRSFLERFGAAVAHVLERQE